MIVSDRTPGGQGDQVRNAIANVLVNAFNYPPKVSTRILGQDMTPLIDKVTEAVESVVELDRVFALMRDLIDPDDCSFDHHGGCQAHGYLTLQPGELCPVAEAKALLAEHYAPQSTTREEYPS